MTTPTDAEIIVEAIDSKMLDVHTAIPCKVKSYDNATQTAELIPQIKRALLDDNDEVTSEELPVLPNVPIAFPRSSEFFMSFPLAAGDFVLAIFAETSIDKWRSHTSAPVPLPSDIVSPGDLRRHSLTGAIGIPCLYPNASALSDSHASDMVLGHEGGAHVNIKTGGTVEVTSGGAHSADDFVAQAAKTLTELAAIVSDHNTHTHPAPGGATSAPTTPMPAASSVASSNLKADN